MHHQKYWSFKLDLSMIATQMYFIVTPAYPCFVLWFNHGSVLKEDRKQHFGYFQGCGHSIQGLLSLKRRCLMGIGHDDVIKWKHFSRYWPFVRGIHRSPVNSSHKGQWRGALMFTLICARINGWVNNREAGDLRRNRAHYDVIVMNPHCKPKTVWQLSQVYNGNPYINKTVSS